MLDPTLPDPNISVLPAQFKFCILLFIFAFPFFVTSCENLSAIPNFSYSAEEGLTLSTTLKVIKEQKNASK
jgi:hypothetical protein